MNESDLLIRNGWFMFSGEYVFQQIVFPQIFYGKMPQIEEKQATQRKQVISSVKQIFSLRKLDYSLRNREYE